MSLSQAGIDALLDSNVVSELNSSATTETGGFVGTVQPTRPTPTNRVGPREPQIQRILGLSVPVTVVLAERDMPIESVLAITVGTIIEFEVPFDSELTLEVANQPIGQGQAVKTGEHFGLRVVRIGTVRDRINAMGGQ